MESSVPRGWIRSSSGVFSLHESDRQCGSYILVEDVAEILQVSTSSLNSIPKITHGKKQYITDKDIGRAWATRAIDSPRLLLRRENAMLSFDEIILLRLIEINLPGAIIEPQCSIGNYLVDFRITHNNVTRILEFFGPYHFIRRSPRERPPRDPRDRIVAIEKQTAQECIIWPYWVQRCATNVKALFDTSLQGIGSIWSTSAQFGDFWFRDSAAIILQLNSRFRIERPDGIGYMYTDELVSKPAHPIIKRIREGKDAMDKLIPPGSTLPTKYWVPKELWSLAR